MEIRFNNFPKIRSVPQSRFNDTVIKMDFDSYELHPRCSYTSLLFSAHWFLAPHASQPYPIGLISNLSLNACNDFQIIGFVKVIPIFHLTGRNLHCLPPRDPSLSILTTWMGRWEWGKAEQRAYIPVSHLLHLVKVRNAFQRNQKNAALKSFVKQLDGWDDLLR